MPPTNVPSASVLGSRRGQLPLTVAAAGLVVSAAASVLGAAPAAATTASAPAHPVSVTADAASAHTATLTSFSTIARPDPAHLSVRTVAAHAASKARPAKKATTAAKVVKAAPTEHQLVPTGTSGPQQFMTLGAAQRANARTIVHQAIHKGMGVRSAVIAVATAMQESQLVNVNYGTSDSLGLFQQQPDMGWGTAAQVMNPAYSADAFLSALRQHQLSDPSWAAQPLWANAQAVQRSAFPTAYAKWEAQAAQLVRQIVG